MLVEQFYAYVCNLIDEEGIYPIPGMAIMPDGEQHIAAITEPKLAYEWFWKQVTVNGAEECIFGLDRTTKEEQGTEFADVLTCCHWRENMDGKKWGTSFRIGVIDYQREPRIARQWNWENQFWIEKMTGEAKSFRPALRMVVSAG